MPTHARHKASIGNSEVAQNTILGKDASECECGNPLGLGIAQSFAGWYVGWTCDQCGPVSRESRYFLSWGDAKVYLNDLD